MSSNLLLAALAAATISTPPGTLPEPDQEPTVAERIAGFEKLERNLAIITPEIEQAAAEFKTCPYRRVYLMPTVTVADNDDEPTQVLSYTNGNGAVYLSLALINTPADIRREIVRREFERCASAKSL